MSTRPHCMLTLPNITGFPPLCCRAIRKIEPRLTKVTLNMTDKLDYTNWRNIRAKRPPHQIGTKVPHDFFFLVRAGVL